MKPNYGSKENTFTSTVGVAEQHGQDEKTRGGRDPRESGKTPKEKLINVACVSLIFTFTVTFTSCRSRARGGRVNEGRRSETPGAHMGSWLRCHVITGGGGWLTQI